MIRFRNPGSNLETMIAVFKTMYADLKDEPCFSNDDIASVLSKANLMASSGFTGEEALQRGANEDRSRDKTYNNAKMYAETFRLLGLISVAGDVSSEYVFTFLGQHMAADNIDTKALVEQCVLGMNNPNKVIDVSYTESVRFFACVLNAMAELDDVICRDEMIIGPMSVNDDFEGDFENMLAMIRELRKKKKHSLLVKAVEETAKRQVANKSGGMTVVSVQNCTRFPISVLKYCGWVVSENLRIYDRSVTFLKLTPHGKETVQKIKRLADIRLSDYEDVPEIQKEALIRLGMYQMLGRANFELEPVRHVIDEDMKICDYVVGNQEVLFSPYQTLEVGVVNAALNIEVADRKHSTSFKAVETYVKKIAEHTAIAIEANASINRELMTPDTNDFIAEVLELKAEGKTIDDISVVISKKHSKDNKTPFYPFVETLFRIIGVNCVKTRDGVNSERWDAMIRDSQRSIPIEIKSPGEEEYLSIKAVRQALENKIVLLSRKSYTTDKETSSFAVGYNIPNDRSEVMELIGNIKQTYGYKIAVFDIHTLIRIAVNIIVNGRGIDISKLYDLEGVVTVDDIKG